MIAKIARVLTAALLVGCALVPAAPAPAQAVACSYGSTPIVTLSAQDIATAQSPGRQFVYFDADPDRIMAIVDGDTPGWLAPSQTVVDLELDPASGVTWSKSLEGWGACKVTRRFSQVVQKTRDYCSPLTASNNYWADCTSGTTWQLLDRQTSPDLTELWFRKPAFLGVWVDAMVVDSSFWKAFGGRVVRFIWVRD